MYCLFTLTIHLSQEYTSTFHVEFLDPSRCTINNKLLIYTPYSYRSDGILGKLLMEQNTFAYTIEEPKVTKTISQIKVEFVSPHPNHKYVESYMRNGLRKYLQLEKEHQLNHYTRMIQSI